MASDNGERNRVADALAAMASGQHESPPQPEPAAPPPLPAPASAAALRHRPHATPPAARAQPTHQAVHGAIELRRTLIPMSLTGGVLLVITGLARWVVATHSPLAALPTALSLALLAVGLVLIGAGVLNMLAVRNMYHALRSPSDPGLTASRARGPAERMR